MPLDMNPEIRAQWCAALRSGEYPQTTEALRRLPGESPSKPEGHCCLGVLTDLWLKAGHSEMIPDDDFDGCMISVWANVDGILSEPVADWAGLCDCDPALRPGLGGSASHFNDSGRTFAEIADLIDGGAA